MFRSCFRNKDASAQSYTGAGCLFTNGVHTLAGYQSRKSEPTISGFGGKREPEETDPFQTALRETLEELFGIHKEVIAAINLPLKPKRIIQNGSYHVYVFSFADLELMLYRLQEAGVTSPYYLYLPNTVADLIFHRRVDSDAEIGSLCLLPAESRNISKEFLEDMKRVLI
jgi:8-oxo-dGTP pyrophosphatase MutT (NUDIX family)